MAEIDASLVSVEQIPKEYRGVFAEFPYFNKVQSAIFDVVLNSDKPFVLAAPTGSGKTVIFELAIIRLLTQIDSPILQSTKIIYVAPMKALCEERYVDWYKKFNNFGLKCVSITGDSNQTFMDILGYNIIITTPEKWDTLTRRWRDYKKLVSSIKLFLIDEIHLLNEDRRGATLETIVCRMKTIESSLHKDKCYGIRFVAVSATIPNIEDIAQWIGNKQNTAASYSFSEDMRPVKLNKIVIGYQTHDKNAFKFDIMLNYKLQTIIMQYAEGKPALIFCSTRKSVEMTSKYISQNITVNMTFDQKSVLLNAARVILDSKCKDFLLHGVGYHHAGMLLESRKIVEDLFRNGDLPILVTTSTLAMGVNLPAHLVIVKSTKCFMNGEYRDYSEGTVLQMIGRAGRPQFDTSATAVILTTVRDKIKYESMVDRGQAIESNLHKHLIEHLNADICLKTVTDLGIALQWISSTFLYVRAKKSPKFYGLPANLTDKELDGKLLEMCQIDINRLSSAGMIFMDHVASLTPTHLGYLMADYYIAFDTMKVFISIKGDEVLVQMLMILSRCREFAEMYLRASDKKSLNLLNKNKNQECIRFPYNARITNAEMKINCLIQAVFGCLPIFDHSLLNDASKIIRAGQRLTGCLTKYLETRTNCFLALLNSYILAKCFQAKIWENSKFVSRQLSDIGTVRSKLLVDAEKTTFQSILDSNPRDLERIMKRKAPFGDNIRDQIMSFPFYEMSLTKKSAEKLVEIKITLTNPGQLNKSAAADDLMILLVGDDKNNILLHEKYTHGYMKDNVTIEKVVEYHEDILHINANFICDDKVGLDCIEILEINPKMDKSYVDENIGKAKIVTSVKKSNTKKVPMQKTMNNYFPVIKQTSLETQKKIFESPNKENISHNSVAPQIDTFEPSTSKSINISAEYLKSDIDSQTFLNDINQIKLTADIKQTHDKQTTKPLPSNNLEPKPSTSLSQVAALDVIQMLNNKFRAKPKMAPPKPTKSILSKPTMLRNYLADFEAKSKKKLQGTESRRLAAFADLEDSLCNETNAEVPKKKVLTNEGTSVGVADSTVNNDCTYEAVVIEPEEYSQRVEKHNMTARNITWRSPLTSSPRAKHSPQNIFSFSKTNKDLINSVTPKTIQPPKQTQSSQFTWRSDKNIPFFPITDKQVEEAELQELSSSQNSFIDPELFSIPRREGQKDLNKLANVSVSSAKAVYAQNPPSNYYKSLEALPSPEKDAADDRCNVAKDRVERTDNFDGLLDDDGNEFLQEAMLKSFDNVLRYEEASLLTQHSPKVSANEELLGDFNNTNTSNSTKLSSKSSPNIVGFGGDNNQCDEEQFTPRFVTPQEDSSNHRNPTLQNQSQTRTHLESNFEHFNDTQTQFRDSPPRIEFDQLIRNYFDTPQTSRYFDRPHGHQAISSYASQRENFHNPMQSQRGLMNQIGEPIFWNRTNSNIAPDDPLNSGQCFHRKMDRPLRYGEEFFTEPTRANRIFPMPYQKQNCSSQMVHRSFYDRSAANNFRCTNHFNPHLQRDNCNCLTQQLNDRRFDINPYPVNRVMNGGPPNAFGSPEEQTLYNERHQRNSAAVFHQNPNRFIDFPHGGVQRPTTSSQFRMPQIDLGEPYANYSEFDERVVHQNSHMNSARRIGGSQNLMHQPQLVEDQSYRAMEQGSQLMDALNPPEERDGKRLIFSRFMNSLDKRDSDY